MSPDGRPPMTVPVYDGRSSEVVDQVARELLTTGVATATDVLDAARVEELIGMVDEAVACDAQVLPQERWETEYGRVVFLPTHDRRFLDLLEHPVVTGPSERILGDDCILYTMTTSCSPPFGTGRPLHVDTTIVIPGYQLVHGVSILLDDFDEATGSTRFLPEIRTEPPSLEHFERNAVRLTAPAGSVCWFDARLWHDATKNHTSQWRRLIILAFIRPFMRQRFDMARMVGHLDPEGLSERIQKRLGFGLLPPGSYEEFYLTAEERRSALIRSGIDRARPPEWSSVNPTSG